MSQQEVTVTRRKPEVSSKVGLRLNLDAEKRLIVTRMAADSLFADSELAVGMQILSINGLDTSEDMSAEEATGLIKRIKGNLTLVAAPPAPEPEPEPEPEPVTVTAVKEHTSSKIGLRLGVSTANGKKLIITRIADDSIFANTALQTGMVVLSINGLQLDDEDEDGGGFSAEQAMGLIKRVKGSLTIQAVVPPPAPPGNDAPVATSVLPDNSDTHSVGTAQFSITSTESGGSSTTGRRTVTVSKTSPDQKVGLSLAQTAAGMVITRVDPHGLFGGQVQPNVRLISVNNVNVKKLPVPLVRNMIGRVAGELTLVIETPQEMPVSYRQPHPVSPVPTPNHLMAPVIEVVDTEYMMGEGQNNNALPPEVVVARPPSRRPKEQAPQMSVEARAYRESVQTKVGIRLKCKTNGSVLIDHVASDGLFQHSRLQSGMQLQSVNGVPVTGRPHAQVVQMIGQTIGELRLVATPY